MNEQPGIPATYSASCDMCSYSARVEATSPDDAAKKLAEDLAAHNFETHDAPTNVDTIIEPIKAKMVNESE